MKQLMRVLLSLTSLCLICFSCSVGRKIEVTDKQPILLNATPVFRGSTSEAVFRVSIDLYSHYYSGIFVIKKESGEKYRLVLMSEVGMTLLDMDFSSENYHVNYCIKPLQKKSLLKLLVKDFLLLTTTPGNEKVLSVKKVGENQYLIKNNSGRNYYFFENEGLVKIISNSLINRTLVQFAELNSGISNSIQINHSPVKLKMLLKRIN